MFSTADVLKIAREAEEKEALSDSANSDSEGSIIVERNTQSKMK